MKTMDPRRVNFLVDFIAESDAIGNIADDRAFLRREIEDETLKDGGKQDGHVDALCSLENILQYGDNEEKLLREIHIKLLQLLIVGTQHAKKNFKDRYIKPVPKKYLGHYRNGTIFAIGGEECKPAYMVPFLMKKLMREIHAWQKTCGTLSKEENILTVARFHYDFKDIHPFTDGNGRTDRAIAYYLLRFAHIEPFVFTAHDRRDYYKAHKSKSAMEHYFLKKAKVL